MIPLVRQLLYKDKTLDEFDIESEYSLFKCFYEVLLNLDGTRVTDLYVEKNITDMFNDACYICTVAMIIKRPYLKLGYFREICYQKKKSTYHSSDEMRADIVLSMVYFLLEKYIEGSDNTKKLMSVINSDLRKRSNDSCETYEKFFYACEPFVGMIPPGYFNKKTITSEELNNMNIDWKIITDNFDKNKLTELVSFWSEPHQRNLIIDNIESNVNSYLFDDDLPF